MIFLIQGAALFVSFPRDKFFYFQVLFTVSRKVPLQKKKKFSSSPNQIFMTEGERESNDGGEGKKWDEKKKDSTTLFSSFEEPVKEKCFMCRMRRRGEEEKKSLKGGIPIRIDVVAVDDRSCKFHGMKATRQLRLSIEKSCENSVCSA